MSEQGKIPSERLREVNADVGAAFRAMRTAIEKAGPLDYTSRECVMLSAFAAAGFEESFRIHALRAARRGIPKTVMHQAVLLVFGATSAMVPVVNALQWIDDAFAQHAATGAGVETVRSADGTPIGFERFGEGPPLVLVHGTSSERSRWTPVRALQQRRTVVHAMDRRGRGASGDTAPYRMERGVRGRGRDGRRDRRTGRRRFPLVRRDLRAGGYAARRQYSPPGALRAAHRRQAAATAEAGAGSTPWRPRSSLASLAAIAPRRSRRSSPTCCACPSRDRARARPAELARAARPGAYAAARAAREPRIPLRSKAFRRATASPPRDARRREPAALQGHHRAAAESLPGSKTFGARRAGPRRNRRCARRCSRPRCSIFSRGHRGKRWRRF